MRNIILTCLIVVLLGSSACAQAPSAALPALSGEKAMEHVRAQVTFGPRPPGSEALEKCREYLIKQLVGYGYEVEKDAFEATTPYGPKRMVNLIARMKGSNTNIIAMASHYDTKYFQNMRFVGANDAGSSTGLLLELARVLAAKKDGTGYWFLFLDGEEAFVDWSTFDSTYGSRHLAKRWKEDGTASKVRALLLLDMIGDKNLNLQKDENSTPWLMDLVWNTAQEEGFRDILAAAPTAIQDDHIPFLDVKIPCADIIDLDYDPWWHTEGDTLDKISAVSMEKVGKLVLAVLPRLEKRLSGR
jgi:glutaminyl-peptide cyclotransferase